MQPIGLSTPVIRFLQGAKDLDRPRKRKFVRRKVMTKGDSRQKPHLLCRDAHRSREGNRKGGNPLPAGIVEHCQGHES